MYHSSRHQRPVSRGGTIAGTAPSYEQGFAEQSVGVALRGRRDQVLLVDTLDELEAPVAPRIDALSFHNLSSQEAPGRLQAPGGGLDQLAASIAAGKARFGGAGAAPAARRAPARSPPPRHSCRPAL